MASITGRQDVPNSTNVTLKGGAHLEKQSQSMTVRHEQHPEYVLDYTIDTLSQRVRAECYRGNILLVGQRLCTVAKKFGLAKVIIKARAEDWQVLLGTGFILEGIYARFYRGVHAYAMVKYFDLERRVNVKYIQEDDILEQVIQNSRAPAKALASLPSEYTVREATLADSKELVVLYKLVFPVYPTPLHTGTYIEKLIDEGTVFYVVEHQERIVSAASAHIDERNANAEIADCATQPEYRKQGLMKVLIDALEQVLTKQGIFLSYAHARAQSFGMNAAFHQLNYTYHGRLVNNCVISESLEDLNIWTKDLSLTD